MVLLLSTTLTLAEALTLAMALAGVNWKFYTKAFLVAEFVHIFLAHSVNVD